MWLFPQFSSVHLQGLAIRDMAATPDEVMEATRPADEMGGTQELVGLDGKIPRKWM